MSSLYCIQRDCREWKYTKSLAEDIEVTDLVKMILLCWALYLRLEKPCYPEELERRKQLECTMPSNTVGW